MFSLQRILGGEEKLFSLLEASAEEARKSVRALAILTKGLDQRVPADEFARLRLIDKKITAQIAGMVYSTFVTALDREDIAELSEALYKIPKMVDKFTERLLISPPRVRAIDFSGQIGFLEGTTNLVLQMVHALRKEGLDQIKELNVKLQALEGDADREMMALYGKLLEGQYNLLEVIALKDLYEQLEKVIDRCRDAGNVVARISLKNS